MKQVAQMLGVELNEEFIIRREGIKCKLTKYGLEYLYEPSKKWVTGFFLNKILNGTFEFVKIPKPFLDETEKEYLSNVIKPFRNQVKYIEKNLGTDQYDNQYEFIRFYLISVKANSSDEILDFPYYKADTMYKGMELGKRYSLKDLGL